MAEATHAAVALAAAASGDRSPVPGALANVAPLTPPEMSLFCWLAGSLTSAGTPGPAMRPKGVGGEKLLDWWLLGAPMGWPVVM